MFGNEYLTNQKARVLSINISKGGIPKLPIDSARIAKTGLEGDGHNHDKHNNPNQAVSLQDIEKLDELSNEGYILSAGEIGENFTVSNLNVNQLPIGTQLEFSGGVVLELSKVRNPCYVLDAINPELKEDIKGRCGIYAKVIREGVVEKGENISVVENFEHHSPPAV